MGTIGKELDDFTITARVTQSERAVIYGGIFNRDMICS